MEDGAVAMSGVVTREPGQGGRKLAIDEKLHETRKTERSFWCAAYSIAAKTPWRSSKRWSERISPIEAPAAKQLQDIGHAD